MIEYLIFGICRGESGHISGYLDRIKRIGNDDRLKVLRRINIYELTDQTARNQNSIPVSQSRDTRNRVIDRCLRPVSLSAQNEQRIPVIIRFSIGEKKVKLIGA